MIFFVRGSLILFASNLHILDVLAWVLVTAIQIATAAGLIKRFYSTAPCSSKLLAGFVLFAFLNILYFHIMMALAAYNIQGMLACSLLGLIPVWRHVPHWNGKIPRVWSRFPRMVRFTLLACLPLVMLRLIRSAVIPPLTWDALTYHLVKPAYWIQDEVFLLKPAPESWAYYEFFSYYAEALFSQAMLFTRNESLVWILEWVFSAMTALAVYSLCQLRQADRTISLLAGLFTLLCPAILNWLPSSHVDTMATGFLYAGIAFAVAFAGLEQHRATNFALALIAFALSCGMKNSMLPYCAVSILALFIIAPAGLPFRQIAGLSPLLLILVPPYARAWYYTGNPLYPLPLNLGPIKLEGNQQLVQLLTHGTTGRYSWSEFWRYAETLLVGWKHLQFQGGRIEYLNFGLPAIGMMLLAVAGLIRTLTLRPLWFSSLLVISMIAINTWAWFSPMANVQGSWWLDYAGRFLLPMYLGLIILGASFRAPAIRTIWVLLCAGHIIYHVPRGIDFPLETAYLGGIAAAAVIASGILFLSRMPWLAHSIPARLAIVLTTIMVFLVSMVAIRDHAKWPYYEQIKHGKLFLQQGLSGTNSPEWAIWKDLSNKSSAIINVSAGFGNGGLNWYRYPLFGDHFQHKLTYVSPYENRELVNGDDKTKPPLVSPEVWLQRLQKAGIRYAAALGPKHQEYTWMNDHPESFHPVSYSATKASTLYMVAPFTPKGRR